MPSIIATKGCRKIENYGKFKLNENTNRLTPVLYYATITPSYNAF